LVAFSAANRCTLLKMLLKRRPEKWGSGFPSGAATKEDEAAPEK
jgi:hypothetical protein